MNTTRHFFAQLHSAEVRYFSVLPAILCLALFWPFGSGKEIHMISAQQVPAAHGVIHAKTTNNGNTQVDIKVQSLAKPSALTPPASTYVVWIQPSGKKAINEGALHVDGNQKGELKTVSPYKDFKVFITAEKYAQLQEPQGATVLSAQVSS